MRWYIPILSLLLVLVLVLVLVHGKSKYVTLYLVCHHMYTPT